MKKRILLYCVISIMFYFMFNIVACNNINVKNSDTEGYKTETKLKNKEDLLEEAIEKLKNKEIDECIKIMQDNSLSPNDKCKNGETLYNNLLAIALEKSADILNFPSNYFPVFDYMKPYVDKSLIKYDDTNLNENQINFLGCIGIESEEQRFADTMNIYIEDNMNKEQKQSNNFTMNGLELLTHGTSQDGRYVVGTIRNNNNFNCSYVEVKAKITDTSGNVLDTPIANVTYLGAGETWSYSIPVITNGYYNYQIIEMSCNK